MKHTTTEDEGAISDGLGKAFSLAIRPWEDLVESRALDETSIIFHKLKI